MILEELLSRLEGVKQTRRGYVSKCPAHNDRTPSLTISEGDRGLLLHCFALCPLEAICDAIGIKIPDLFYDQARDPRECREAQRKRQVERHRREAIRNVQGLNVDVRREAEGVIASALNPGLVGWSDEYLDQVIEVVANAYDVLFAEKVEHGDWSV